MIPAQRRIRHWSAIASAMAQIAATAAGMLPWWALPVTLGVTIAVTRSTGPVDPAKVRLSRNVGVAGVGLFSGLIAAKAISAGNEGTDPIATLRSLTEALVILSLVMAPHARTAREYRVWLTVTTGVLVAAAAGGESVVAAALTVAGWVILLVATTLVQAAGPVMEGAVVATAVDASGQAANGRNLGHLSVLLPVGAALITGTLVFFMLPAGLGGDGLANKIASRVAGNPQGDVGSRESIGVDTYGAGELDLDLRGQLPDTPVLHVPARSPALWRGTFYSIYTGHGWVANNDRSFVFAHGNDLDVPTSAFDPVPSGRSETDRATVAPGFRTSLVWSPGVPTHITGVDGSITGVARQSANTRAVMNRPAASYRVTSTVAPTTPSVLRASTGGDPLDAEWTQLPSGLPPTILQLARRVTSHASNRYEQVKDIETYLRGNETYTLDSPVPGSGDDAVSDFLFRDHAGFCEQFASAEAVMLRTLGVPTRLVSGLAYGTRDRTGRLYTAANAHAWVEVYYPGVGWSPSDPTAGATPEAASAAPGSWVSRLLGSLTANLPGGRTALIVILCVLGAG
ncbi:MAG: transglutaminase domain-containing protein, partial [Frankiaceae bacterium]|nr:transglutaminase domain-containing protein [Frankiaceae bacterium]